MDLIVELRLTLNMCTTDTSSKTGFILGKWVDVMGRARQTNNIRPYVRKEMDNENDI